jgi:hypothetical protein
MAYGCQIGGYAVNDFVPPRLVDAILAERMRSRWPELSFFNSLHAATSKAQGSKLLTSKRIYKKISPEVVDLDSI